MWKLTIIANAQTYKTLRQTVAARMRDSVCLDIWENRCFIVIKWRHILIAGFLITTKFKTKLSLCTAALFPQTKGRRGRGGVAKANWTLFRSQQLNYIYIYITNDYIQKELKNHILWPHSYTSKRSALSPYTPSTWDPLTVKHRCKIHEN